MSSIARKLTLLLCAGSFLFLMTGCTESQQELERARMDFERQMRQLEQDYQLQLSQLDWDRQRYFLDRDLELRKPGDDPADKPSDDPTDKPGDDPADKPGDDPADKPGDKPNDDLPTINYTLNDVTVELTWQQLVQILNLGPAEEPRERRHRWRFSEDSLRDFEDKPAEESIQVAEAVEEGPTETGMRADDDACLGEGTVESTDMEEK